MKLALLVIPVAIVGGAAATGWVQARKGLLTQRASISAEWPNVADALERRADAVSNVARILQAVTGANPVFDEIAASKADLTKAATVQEKIQANSRLMQASARLLVLSEKYPRLNADRYYRQALDEYKETENTVAIERLKYNESLEHYNAQLHRFPDNVVSRMSGLARDDDYVITEQEVK